MSAAQRVYLKEDEAFDLAQEFTGYPAANPNDEGLPNVNVMPSLIYPEPNLGTGCWQSRKYSYGPTSSDLAHWLGFKSGPGIGRHKNGQEDYAD